MKVLYLILIIVVIILTGCTALAVHNAPITARLSLTAKLHFLNWYGQDGCCSVTSEKCEEYFETVHHLPCYLVYGDKGYGTDEWLSHIWNIVMIDDIPYEFESTTLVFHDVSDMYRIHDMQEGFYMDGIEYEKSQSLDNWKELGIYE